MNGTETVQPVQKRDPVLNREPAQALELLAESLSRIARLCPEAPLLAIPWMHLKHPIHSVQQAFLMHSTPQEGRACPPADRWRAARNLPLRCMFAAVGSLVYSIYFTLRLVQIRLNHHGVRQALQRRRFDLVAKTWRFESSQGFGDTEKGTREDFYYGDLQQRLKGKGVSMLLLYDYPRKSGWAERANPSNAESAHLQELSLLPLGSAIRFSFQQQRTSRRLLAIARSAQGMDVLVAERAALDCLSPRHFRVGLSGEVFRVACALWRPKILLTLYEGHAWEQLAWEAAQKVAPSCRTVGYQHTVLLPHQWSLLRSADGSPVTAKPDVVLCLGPKTAQMLQPGHPHSRLIPFGTFRRSAQGSIPSLPAPQKKTILVLPEAHPEEMDLMFQTALQAAKLLPDHRFILRCHPIIPSPRKLVLKHAGKDPRLLPNVEISSGKGVEEDFIRSSAILYRGSSAVLYAIRFGLKPIYLHDGILPDLDPLFELQAWKEQVSGADPLADCLRGYADQNPCCLEKEWAVATEFVRTYAIPVDDSSVNQLVKELS